MKMLLRLVERTLLRLTPRRLRYPLLVRLMASTDASGAIRVAFARPSGGARRSAADVTAEYVAFVQEEVARAASRRGARWGRRA